MGTIATAGETLKLLQQIENPISIGVAIGVIVLGAAFIFWRKLTTSEYVTAGKEQWSELMDLYNSLKKELEETKNELAKCHEIISGLKEEIAILKPN